MTVQTTAEKPGAADAKSGNGSTGQAVVAKKLDEPIIVRDDVALFDTGMFEHMWRIANTMAAMNLMPDHLKGKPADCVLVVEQARTWGMSPTAVGSKTFAVGGKLGYEGQLVAAVVNTRANLKGRLNYRYEGEFNRAKIDDSTRKVIVSGTFNGENEVREITVEWRDGHAASKGARDKWLSQPDQQLAYFGARVWARRHCPEVLLGVYTPEEIEAERDHRGPDNARDITPARPQRSNFAERVDTSTGPAETETKPYEAISADGEIQIFTAAADACAFVLAEFERRKDAQQAVFEHNAELLARFDEEKAVDQAHAIRHDFARWQQAARAGNGETEKTGESAKTEEAKADDEKVEPILPPLRTDGNWTAWKNDAVAVIESLPAQALGEVEAEMALVKMPDPVHVALTKTITAKKGKK